MGCDKVLRLPPAGTWSSARWSSPPESDAPAQQPRAEAQPATTGGLSSQRYAPPGVLGNGCWVVLKEDDLEEHFVIFFFS